MRRNWTLFASLSFIAVGHIVAQLTTETAGRWTTYGLFLLCLAWLTYRWRRNRV
jgi:hypothetical protein